MLKIALETNGDIPLDFVQRATASTLLHKSDVLSGMPIKLQSIPDSEALIAYL